MEVCLRFVVEMLAPCQSLFEGLGFSLGARHLYQRRGLERIKPGSLLAWRMGIHATSEVLFQIRNSFRATAFPKHIFYHWYSDAAS
jgi:hypothetical protein